VRAGLLLARLNELLAAHAQEIALHNESPTQRAFVLKNKDSFLIHKFGSGRLLSLPVCG
jgi:hypothetical protein